MSFRSSPTQLVDTRVNGKYATRTKIAILGAESVGAKKILDAAILVRDSKKNRTPARRCSLCSVRLLLCFCYLSPSLLFLLVLPVMTRGRWVCRGESTTLLIG